MGIGLGKNLVHLRDKLLVVCSLVQFQIDVGAAEVAHDIEIVGQLLAQQLIASHNVVLRNAGVLGSAVDAAHKHLVLVVQREGLAHGVALGEEFACHPFLQHHALLVGQRGVRVALKEREAEHVVIGAVHIEHVALGIVVLRKLHVAVGHAEQGAGRLNLRQLFAQQGDNLARGAALLDVVFYLRGMHQHHALLVRNLLVHACLVLIVQAYEDNKHERHRQSEHVDGGVRLVPGEERKVGIDFHFVFLFYFVVILWSLVCHFFVLSC